MACIRSRAWTFTHYGGDNRFDSADDPRLSDESLREALGGVKFAVMQLESAPTTGRLHLQGYFFLEGHNGLGRRTIFQRYPFLTGAHLEPAQGTVDQNIAYCTKEESRVAGPWQFGEPPRSGRPSNKQHLEEAVEAMKTYGGPDKLAIAEPVLYAKFYRQLEALWVHVAPKPIFDDFEPRPWQSEVLDILAQDPHPRHVNWIVDEVGGQGKTLLSKYLVSTKDAFYSTGGKHADIFHAFVQSPKSVVVFDFCRDQEERVCYSVIEALKNGIVFSGKYQSCSRSFSVPHVVCFSNFHPDQSKLSRDRWRIKVLEEGAVPDAVQAAFL